MILSGYDTFSIDVGKAALGWSFSQGQGSSRHLEAWKGDAATAWPDVHGSAGGLMASVNGTSLREEFDAARARIAALRKAGRISDDVDAVIGVLCSLLGILIAIFLEKTTRKTGKNSSIAPSQTDKDNTGKRSKKASGKGVAPNWMTGENLRKVTVGETSTVQVCDSCGADLSDVEPSAREERIHLDIMFEVVEKKVVAETRDCPKCRTRTKGRFPENMPGPLQYGVGFQAFVINLLIAQMLSLRRAVELVRAISGVRMSQATCLGYIQRLHEALEPWETAAAAHLLTRPALHADETGFRVDSKNQWLHVLTDDSLTLIYGYPGVKRFSNGDVSV